MHTLDGKPAHYEDGEQLVFSLGHTYLVKDLKTISSQRKLNDKWRKSKGYPFDDVKYGYIKVTVG